MTAIERVRAVPPRWWAIGGGVLAAVVVVALLAGAGGADSGFVIDGTLRSVPTTTTPDGATSSTATSSSVATTARTGTSTTVDATSTTVGSGSTVPLIAIDLASEYELDVDEDDPAISERPIPDQDAPPPTTVAPPPWAASTRVTSGGHLSTDVGCAFDGSSAADLDAFLADRVGPVLGWDYQHVYPLGGGRHLWLFQDVFLDHSGTVSTLASSRFVHNAAMVQEGNCFRLLHRGSSARPAPFEAGDGTGGVRTKWFWPMGGELVGDELWVFWAEMVKDPYDPAPPDGLGWHPSRTWLAAYDADTLERLAFVPAPASSVTPIYGYAVASDASHTYLFGNTFEQNMVREGGFWNGPHSATEVYLARVPRGRLTAAPEYRTGDGWSSSPADARPIVSRFWAENPMQPRYLDGQWIATTAVDGYWGDHLAVDVADQPWGPWTTVQYDPLLPRGADPKMNTYHAHPVPWRDGFGSVIITVSNNARNMRRDAWYQPHRYRPMVFSVPYRPTPTTTTTTTTSTTTTTTSTTTTTTSSSTTTSTSTTRPTTTTTRPTTTTTSSTSTTTTTAVPSTSTTTTSAPSTTTSTTTSSSVPSTTTSSTTTTSTTLPGGG